MLMPEKIPSCAKSLPASGTRFRSVHRRRSSLSAPPERWCCCWN